MKKALLIFFGLILLIFVALFTVPYLFKDEIVSAVKKEINNNIDAQLGLKDVGISIFTHFPNITLDLKELSLTNLAPFEGDTLAKFSSFSVTVSLSDLISSKKIVVTDLELMNPYFDVKVNAEGKANYDIVKSSEETESAEIEEEKTDDSDISFALKHYGIYNAHVHYLDVPGAMAASVEGLTHEGSANFALNQFDVSSNTLVEALSIAMDGTSFLSKERITLDMVLGMDLDKMLFSLKENNLKINDLSLALDGSVEMPTDDIAMDLSFSSKDNTFKSLLSLIPAVFLEGFEELKADGTFGLDGSVKGLYSETSMPSVMANLEINNARVQYPDLPAALEKISAKAQFTSDGAPDFDDAVINLSNLHLEIENNPINATLLLKTPISDPDIRSELYAKMDLAKLKRALPLVGMDLAGNIDLNLTLETALSTVEKEEFEKVKADGSLKMSNFSFSGDSVPYPMSFSSLTAQLSPQYLGFKALDFQTTGIKAQADGFFSNLLSFALHDGILKGEFNATASEINVDPYLEEDSTETQASGDLAVESMGQADPLDFMRLPKNMNIDYKLLCERMLYDGAVFKDISANGYLENGVVYLSEAKTKLFSAPVKASGNFNTVVDKPTFALTASLTDFDIQAGVAAFESINTFFPIAKSTKGQVNTDFTLSGAIGYDLFPEYPSINGSGIIKTYNVVIENSAAFNKAAEKLKFDFLKKQKLDNTSIQFEISDGSLFIKPFSTKIGAMDAKFVGRTGLDQSIDYTVNLDVPTKIFPSEAMAVVNGLASKASSLLGKEIKVGEKVNIDLLFTNTISDIKVDTRINGSSGKSAVDDAKEKLKEELDKKRQEAEAKAKEELDKAKAEAEAKAKALENEVKAKAAEAKAKAEAEKKRLEEEAKKRLEEEKKKAEEEAKKKLKGAFGKPK